MQVCLKIWGLRVGVREGDPEASGRCVWSWKRKTVGLGQGLVADNQVSVAKSRKAFCRKLHSSEPRAIPGHRDGHSDACIAPAAFEALPPCPFEPFL